MKRIGSIIKVEPGKLEEYKRLQVSVWPEVIETLKAVNVQNYMIIHKDGKLYSYFEYVGNDCEADMQKMTQDP